MTLDDIDEGLDGTELDRLLGEFYGPPAFMDDLVVDLAECFPPEWHLRLDAPGRFVTSNDEPEG